MFMTEYVSELSAENKCTCLSTLSIFIEQNVASALAVALLGVESVTSTLTNVVCDRWFKLCMASA